MKEREERKGRRKELEGGKRKEREERRGGKRFRRGTRDEGMEGKMKRKMEDGRKERK